ncbi:MAG: hypothetical protein M1834_002913 [Cirrosporium novae-zelandiae]|nr:MAG: hypothetical protein M1834_002913 [Cirrosporium novae-zelandiae]
MSHKLPDPLCKRPAIQTPLVHNVPEGSLCYTTLMEQWKDRGYVSDSEDEEAEILSLDYGSDIETDARSDKEGTIGHTGPPRHDKGGKIFEGRKDKENVLHMPDRVATNEPGLSLPQTLPSQVLKNFASTHESNDVFDNNNNSSTQPKLSGQVVEGAEERTKKNDNAHESSYVTTKGKIASLNSKSIAQSTKRPIGPRTTIQQVYAVQIEVPAVSAAQKLKTGESKVGNRTTGSQTEGTHVKHSMPKDELALPQPDYYDLMEIDTDSPLSTLSSIATSSRHGSMWDVEAKPETTDVQEDATNTIMDNVGLLSSQLHQSTSADKATAEADKEALLPIPQSQTSSQNGRAESSLQAEHGRIQIEDYDTPQSDVNMDPPSPRRPLRPRLPIQKHPYLLEGEIYRQMVRNSGQKPIKIDYSHGHVTHRKRHRDSSQDADFEEDETQPNSDPIQGLEEDQDLDELQLPSSPPVFRIPPGVSPKPPRYTSIYDISISDDEFPGIDQLGSRQPRGQVRQTHKRRKIKKALGKDRVSSATQNQNYKKGQASRTLTTTSRRSESSSPILTSSNIKRIRRSGSIITDSTAAPHDEPLSPPPSKGNSSPPEPPGSSAKFQLPRGLSPMHFQTLTTPSEPRKPLAIDTPSSSNSDSEKNSGGTARSTQTAAGNSSEDDESQLQHAQHKIKGVLPASWLKLDLKTRPKIQTWQHRRTPSPNRTPARRGVAIKITRRGKIKSGLQPRDNQVIDISDDSSGSALDTSPRKVIQFQLQASYSHGEKNGSGEDVDDVIEEDHVDPMFPSRRQRDSEHYASGHRKGQPRLSKRYLGERVKSKQSTSLQKYHNSSKRQPKITEHLKAQRTSKSKRKRPPHLGILDGMSNSLPSHQNAPQFLRIAARCAEKRLDKSRHSPGSKFVKLSNIKDTEDAQKVLRNWRAGTIQPTKSKSKKGEVFSTERKSLEQSTGNAPYDSFVTSAFTRIKDVNKASSPSPRPRQQRLTRISSKALKSSITSNTSETSLATRISNHISQSVRKIGRGYLSSAFLDGRIPRAAQLEVAQPIYPPPVRRGLRALLAENPRPGLKRSVDKSIPLRKFLEDEDVVNLPEAPISLSVHNDSSFSENHFRRNVPRKRAPVRISVELDPPILDSSIQDDNQDIANLPSNFENPSHTLQGLGPYNTKYTIDFDTVPFRLGTFFHANTMLGSGEFARSLKFVTSRDLDTLSGSSLITVNSKTYRWGAWDENVSSEIGIVFSSTEEFLDHGQHTSTGDNLCHGLSIFHLMNSVVCYINYHLSFLDPVDRCSFIQRLLVLLKGTWDRLSSLQQNDANKDEFPVGLSVHLLVICYQLLQISEHPLTEPEIKQEIRHLIDGIIQYICSACVTEERIRKIQDLLTTNKQPCQREAGIKDKCIEAEAVIIARHVHAQLPAPKKKFCELINVGLLSHNTAPENLNSLPDLENFWRLIFSLLPLGEIDSSGNLEIGCRFTRPLENWLLVKRLVNRVLDFYPQREGRSSSLNRYIRTLLGRCLHLIKAWGWWKADVIIGALFDFFARNNLAHLRHEENWGSPLFLEELDKNPGLGLDQRDLAFHILLKIIASSLKAMRDHKVPDKQIRGLVWRLMPNHGRRYPKEEEVRQEDLDALRNHQDLLCILYWASPPDSRPKIDVIQGLVDPASSHTQACHLSMRSWENLVKFQLSTDESNETLTPFAKWHDDFTRQMVQQHSTARTEAEVQYTSVPTNARFKVTPTVLESTIANNQRHVEAIISHALESLKVAIFSTKNSSAVTTLLTMSSVSDVFSLFDSKHPRVNGIVIQALGIVSSALDAFKRSEAIEAPQQDSEDSQEYGNWDEFENFVEQDIESNAAKHLIIVIEEPLARLLSNAFGADNTPGDILLRTLIDTWTSVAGMLVKSKKKGWENYLGSYDRASWGSLRDTEQTRKYAAYFMAKIIDTNIECYEDNRMLFLSAWMKALIERESVLKYQHQLTTAILNADLKDPLVVNFPFIKSTGEGHSISAPDFRQHRLQLISTLLSNMRVTLFEIEVTDHSRAISLRHDYKELLKSMMMAMKTNYQELGIGSPKGSYITFVHQVVELLQEHTSDICPVDNFFTDSSAFPLPAKDPTYVVGRLRSYGLRLSDPRTPKQLVVFIQTTSERAAADNRQGYLVSQLVAALSNTFEDGSYDNPTLRAFIINGVIPAYIDMTMNTPMSWVLGKPILEAIRKVLQTLIFDFDILSAKSVNSVIGMISSILIASGVVVNSTINHVDTLNDPIILSLLTHLFLMIQEMLPIIDYVNRSLGNIKPLIEQIKFLRYCGVYFASLVLGQNDISIPDTEPPLTMGSLDNKYAAIRTFARNELRESLTNNWSYHDNRCFVARGHQNKEVLMNDLGDREEETSRLLEGLLEFERVSKRLPAWIAEDEFDVYDGVGRLQDLKRLGWELDIRDLDGGGLNKLNLDDWDLGSLV